jgi:ubiquinone/menaquinone biosynthesis C-methylase UbiE
MVTESPHGSGRPLILEGKPEPRAAGLDLHALQDQVEHRNRWHQSPALGTLMDPFDASRVQAAYDTVAEEYAETFADDLLQLNLDRQVLDEFVQRFVVGELVLDLGCGPGQVSQYLTDSGLLVVGMDLSQRMLHVARRRTGMTHVVCGDMRSIPFGPSCFSGVVAYYSVHNLPRPVLRRAFDEIHRVLKPSGALVVATHLGEGEVYSDEFLGHAIKTVGGNLYHDDELLQELVRTSFVVDEVLHREPLAHEHNTQRIYVSCHCAD